MMTSIHSFLWSQIPIHTTCIHAKVFQHVDKKRKKKKKMLSKVTEETYFLYKRTFKNWNTFKIGLRKGQCQ